LGRNEIKKPLTIYSGRSEGERRVKSVTAESPQGLLKTLLDRYQQGIWQLVVGTGYQIETISC